MQDKAAIKGNRKMNGTEQNRSWFLKGMRDGVPIAMGYFAVAFALGIASKKAGMNALQAGVMSITMLASAGQYGAITVIAGGRLYTDGGDNIDCKSPLFTHGLCAFSESGARDKIRTQISIVLSDYR